MLSQLLLVLSGLFAGLWVGDNAGSLFNIGYPALALASLVAAAITARPAMDRERSGRLAEAFRQWLDAWKGLHTAGERDRAAAERGMAAATHTITLEANYRVVRALKTAKERDLSGAAVALLVVEMRRNLRQSTVGLRPADIEALLAPTLRPTNGRNAAPAPVGSPVSFLS